MLAGAGRVVSVAGDANTVGHRHVARVARAEADQAQCVSISPVPRVSTLALCVRSNNNYYRLQCEIVGG